MSPEQLSFDLSARPALGREDFFVSEANAVALAMVDAWRDWPTGKFLLLGEPGSGKTHLAHVWAHQADARLMSSFDVPSADIEAMASRPNLCRRRR